MELIPTAYPVEHKSLRVDHVQGVENHDGHRLPCLLLLHLYFSDPVDILSLLLQLQGTR